MRAYWNDGMENIIEKSRKTKMKNQLNKNNAFNRWH